MDIVSFLVVELGVEGGVRLSGGLGGGGSPFPPASIFANARAASSSGLPLADFFGSGLAFTCFAVGTTNGALQKGHLIRLPSTSPFGLKRFLHFGRVDSSDDVRQLSSSHKGVGLSRAV